MTPERIMSRYVDTLARAMLDGGHDPRTMTAGVSYSSRDGYAVLWISPRRTVFVRPPQSPPFGCFEIVVRFDGKLSVFNGELWARKSGAA